MKTLLSYSNFLAATAAVLPRQGGGERDDAHQRGRDRVGRQGGRDHRLQGALHGGALHMHYSNK